MPKGPGAAQGKKALEAQKTRKGSGRGVGMGCMDLMDGRDFVDRVDGVDFVDETF